MQDHRCDVARLSEILRPWLAFLSSKVDAGYLSGEFLDATPANGVLKGSEYELIDREFIWDEVSAEQRGAPRISTTSCSRLSAAQAHLDAIQA